MASIYDNRKSLRKHWAVSVTLIILGIMINLCGGKTVMAQNR